MKLKSLDTANDYANFSLPILTLDKETGKGNWAEGADVFVQMHNDFQQEFVREKTVVKWDLETAIHPFEEYFTITKDSIGVKKVGFYELSIQLFVKVNANGLAEDYIKSELTRNKELFGMQTVGIFDKDGNLSLTLRRILEIKDTENNTFHLVIRKAAGQLLKLPYAASLFSIRKLKTI